jgi:hypothetical protein
MGVRPEPYVALGTLATFSCLLRGTEPGAGRPFAWLTTGALAAGLTVAVTPRGVAALLIVATFTPRCLPVITAGPGDRLLTAARSLSLLCVGATGVVAMFADNSLHGVRMATHLHHVLSPSLDWYQELPRYDYLFAHRRSHEADRGPDGGRWHRRRLLRRLPTLRPNRDPHTAIRSPGLEWGHLYVHSYRIQKDAYDVTTRRVRQSGVTGQGDYFFDQ